MYQGLDANPTLGRRAARAHARRPAPTTIDGIDVDGLRPPRRRRRRQPRVRRSTTEAGDSTFVLLGTASPSEFETFATALRRRSRTAARALAVTRAAATHARRRSGARCVRGNERFVAGEPQHPRQDVEHREPLAQRAGAARRALRLQRLPARGRDHLRQGTRRPLRRAQRGPGHLRLGARLARVRRRRARRAAHRRARPRRVRRRAAPRSTPRPPTPRPLPPHIADADRADRARPCDASPAARPTRRSHPTTSTPVRRPRAPARHRRRAARELRADQRRDRRGYAGCRRRELPTRSRGAPRPTSSSAASDRRGIRRHADRQHDPARNRKGSHRGGQRRRLPHRARHDGRGAGSRIRALPRADPARRRELPDLRVAASSRRRSSRSHASRGPPRIVNERARHRSTPDDRRRDRRGRRRGHRRAPPRRSSRSTRTRPAPARRSNMNMNEVLATLATEKLGSPVHPNDHVNASQSSNDVFPTSVHVAVTGALIDDLDPRARPPRGRARDEGRAVGGRRQVRPHPPHGRHAGHPRPGVRRLRPPGAPRHRARARRRSPASPRCRSAAPPSAPASTPPPASRSWSSSCSQHDSELPITEAVDHFEAQGARDGLVEASGALRTIAVSPHQDLQRPALDGLGPEHRTRASCSIPDLQPGSSIMPGKVNPVIPEAVLMVCARVIGNDATIAWAGASGRFELNVQIPVMGTALLESIRLLANSSRAARRQDRRRPRGRTSSAPARSPSIVAVDRDAAQQAHRLRGRREDREALGREGHHGARGGHRPRLRRARRAHRSSSSTRRSTCSR